MKLKKFENDTCHRANFALYFKLFGFFVGLFFSYLESVKAATF